MVKQSHNQNDYYHILHRNIGKRYRNVGITSHYQTHHLLHLNQLNSFLQVFGQIFRMSEVVYISSYNMGTWDFPDIANSCTIGLVALRLGHIISTKSLMPML